MARNAQRERRGNAVVGGLSFGVLLGFSALSVDVGLVRVAASQLQASLDAAALSGASELDGTLLGLAEAKLRAQSVAAQNTMVGRPIDLTLPQVELGTYDPETGVFDPFVVGDDPHDVDAVRIDHTAPQLDSVLAHFVFDLAGYDLRARSMALRPPGAGVATSTECFLPFAVPDCWLAETPPGTNPKPIKFTFSPSPTDAIAWGSPYGQPSNSSVVDQLAGQCSSDPIHVGDPIYTSEGLLEPVLVEIAAILNEGGSVVPTEWDEELYGPIPERLGTPDTANLKFPKSSVTLEHWGNTYEGPVALVDAGPDCDAVAFGGAPMAMSGVAWAVIYDVDALSLDRNVYLQLDLTNEHDIWGEVDMDGVGNVRAPGESTLVAW